MVHCVFDCDGPAGARSFVPSSARLTHPIDSLLSQAGASDQRHRLSAKALPHSPASFRRRPSMLEQEVPVTQDLTDLGQRSE